jgi:prepilin-type processing-associated H-X9-DG protein
MKILLIKALAESHAYSQFINSLHGALAELGHEPVISDQSIHAANGAAPSEPLIGELQSSRYAAVVSFSSFFGGLALDNGVSPFDALGVKFLGWQVDHPIYTPQSLARHLQGRYAVYSNHNHLRFARALHLPGRAIAMLPGGEPPQEPLKDFRSREWPIFIAASWYGRPQALWEQLEDSPGKSLLVGVLNRLSADREASLLDAFNETSKKLGFGAKLGDDPAFDDQMIAFLREPLTHLRNVDRINTIQSLADAGLPLTICGPGWRDFLGDRGNVAYVDGRVDFKDMPALYNNSKIVINFNAGNGACERAICAALAGAAVVSDYSEQLAHLLKSPDELAFFNRAKPGHVVEVVGRLLESDGGEALAERGHTKVVQSGLWRHRAQQMVEFLEVA